MLEPNKILQALGLPFKPYKDTLRITQIFGNLNPNRYGEVGHTGTDVGEQNLILGDKLYAPFDGKVYKARSWSGSNIGWEFYMHSNVLEIDGQKFVIRVGYTHTRGKSPFNDGDLVKRGDVVDTSGGIFNVNAFWNGQHTHITLAPRYQANGIQNYGDDFINWQPDWNNGHAGYTDAMAYLAPQTTNKDMLEKLKAQGFKYIQRVGHLGEVYRLDEKLTFLDSEKGADRHIPLVDEVIKQLSNQKVLTGISEDDYNNLIKVDN